MSFSRSEVKKTKKLLGDDTADEIFNCIRVLRELPRVDKLPSHKNDTEGWLFKRDRNLKWEKTYWRLNGNYLEYFKKSPVPVCQ